jgi:hypothetical protein
VTNASGVYTGSLTSTAAGQKIVSAQATVGGQTTALTQTATVTVVAVVSPTLSTIGANPTTINQGTGTSTITVTVRDASNTPMPGATVTLLATGSGNTLSAPGVTDANGVYSGSLTSTVAEQKVVSASATVGGATTALAGTVTVTVAPGGSVGTISQTLLTAGADPNNVKIYTTASIAPAPNALITVAVLTRNSTGAPPSPVVTGGGMTTWTEVASVTFDSILFPTRRLTIYRAMSPTPGSGPITITFAASQSHAQWIVSQWDGVEITGTNGADAIAQVASARTDAAVSLSVPLAALANANNVAYGAFGVNKNLAVVTPGAGFTEISEQPSNESTSGDLQAEWAVNLNTVTASWLPTSRAGGLGLEIRARNSLLAQN